MSSRRTASAGWVLTTLALPALAALAPLPGCATETPPAPVTAQCPPPPPPIYSHECVLKKDVLDVADRILDENYAYESKLVTLEKSFLALEQEVARALETSLKNVAANQASVAIVGNRVRVRLSEELLFPSARAVVSPNGLRALAQVADVLRTTPSRRIEVAGHTDDRAVHGGWQDNWQLSTERARQVMLALTAHGVPAERLFIAGYADTDPAASGAGDEARARNRRVELFIEPTQPADPKAPPAPTQSTFTPVLPDPPLPSAR